MREVMKDPRAKEIYRKRKGAVEPVFSEIRGVQGLRRFRRKGLQKAKMEFSLHAITHNIRRMFALIELPKILASRTLFFVFQFLTLLTKIISRFSKAIKNSFKNFKNMVSKIISKTKFRFQLQYICKKQKSTPKNPFSTPSVSIVLSNGDKIKCTKFVIAKRERNEMSERRSNLDDFDDFCMNENRQSLRDCRASKLYLFARNDTL